MPFINFSISEDLKESFNKTFRGRNKSAIVAQLMRDAIENERHRQEGGRAIDAILMLRATSPSLEGEDAARPKRRRR
jgi:metal-responsive CopG/Arc/MetJ family transcriptional regulator